MTEEIYLDQLVTGALEDMKAVDIRVIDVRELTTITDTMIIASGTSDRHLRALADKVVETVKAHEVPPLGIEGEDEGDWVLVDIGDVVVHLMLPRIRDFYNLEKLWATQNIDGQRGALRSD